MIDNRKNNKENDMRGSSCRVRPSLFATTEEIKMQIDYDEFEQIRHKRNGGTWAYIDPMIKEMCLIIAEILVMNPDGIIKIGGSEIPTCTVQEAYQMLEHKNIENVLENFRDIKNKIYNKKAYLRTALYNSVFETEANLQNQVSSNDLR